MIGPGLPTQSSNIAYSKLNTLSFLAILYSLNSPIFQVIDILQPLITSEGTILFITNIQSNLYLHILQPSLLYCNIIICIDYWNSLLIVLLVPVLSMSPESDQTTKGWLIFKNGKNKNLNRLKLYWPIRAKIQQNENHFHVYLVPN